MLEKEYIEREAAFEYNEQCKKCFHFQVCASVLKQQLFVRVKMLAEENPKCSYYIPAADVVEVRHGRWINDGEDWFCNRCNHNALCDKMTGVQVASAICPNCGAKMDGKEKNDE